MQKIVFVKTDPSYLLVDRMVKELSYQTVGCSAVTSNGFCNQYSKWYDFSRTAGAVMRLYMLMATNMRQFHDPKFNSKENYAREAFGTNPHSICMANSVYEAQRLSAEFDRLYPHYVLENKFRTMNQGQTKSHTALMYVLDVQNDTIYQVIASLTVTLRVKGNFMTEILAIPMVNAIQIQLQPPPPHLVCPYTELLKSLIDEYNLCNYGQDNDENSLLLHRDVDDLYIGDVQAEVNDYFKSL